MIDRHERLGRLVTNATAQLSAKSPWLVASAVPVCPASLEFSVSSGDELQRWVRQQVAVWPAPISIGSDQPETSADRLTFAQRRSPGQSATGYYCELNAAGSALGALQVGALRDSPADGRPVWAIGEGAIAWITIAMLRLTAAYADHATVLGDAVVELTITSPTAAPIEVWNHNNQAYGPAGTQRIAGVEPRQHAVDLATCLSPDLASAARPLVLDLLGQFGLSESRHIDPAGVIQRRNFTGYDEAILAWTDAIGVPSQP
ncbi:hypothetical protein Aple_013970 [Acrocarpospora pleiomorpha]|uniref:Uncharacterized protein n=1 Tax=Acrocarpospora pleiomorpha TaxID=90975 RepID=A0A5M3XCK3_9ACTN|nr:hypothetical protein [Acrocarpospora pleiomorpha]GES18502.1 hypothetical protein Aple_013970 [Acrocarpospora pleiomorpha]